MALTVASVEENGAALRCHAVLSSADFVTRVPRLAACAHTGLRRRGPVLTASHVDEKYELVGSVDVLLFIHLQGLILHYIFSSVGSPGRESLSIYANTSRAE